MELIRQNFQLELARPNLVGVLGPQWPAGYSLRWFRPGDVCHWLRIHHDAEPFDEITPEVYLRRFGCDFARLAECQCYVQDSLGRVVGTGTAWDMQDEAGGTWGRVFSLAIMRQHQGRGLGKPLLAAICERLNQLGYTRARVATSTGRPAAVNLYLKFGFQPVIRSDGERECWTGMFEVLRQAGHAAALREVPLECLLGSPAGSPVGLGSVRNVA